MCPYCGKNSAFGTHSARMCEWEDDWSNDPWHNGDLDDPDFSTIDKMAEDYGKSIAEEFGVEAATF